jgi:hypothetical protein
MSTKSVLTAASIVPVERGDTAAGTALTATVIDTDKVQRMTWHTL